MFKGTLIKTPQTEIIAMLNKDASKHGESIVPIIPPKVENIVNLLLKRESSSPEITRFIKAFLFIKKLWKHKNETVPETRTAHG